MSKSLNKATTSLFLAYSLIRKAWLRTNRSENHAYVVVEDIDISQSERWFLLLLYVAADKIEFDEGWVGNLLKGHRRHSAGLTRRDLNCYLYSPFMIDKRNGDNIDNKFRTPQCHHHPANHPSHCHPRTSCSSQHSLQLVSESHHHQPRLHLLAVPYARLHRWKLIWRTKNERKGACRALLSSGLV